jgi:hypothetical protein
LIVIACLSVACGRKGPPLPPLVKLPVAPADFVAERRGDAVDLRFAVPSANTDNSKPANVSRVEVYAFTGPTTVTDADVLKYGAKVATVAVKAPRDPNDTVDPNDPEQAEDEVEPPEGEGLDQGAPARVKDTLTPAALVATKIPAPRKQKPVAIDTSDRPLLGAPPATTAARTYIGVGIAANGKKGRPSRRVVIPLVAPPEPPGRPEIKYTETEITVSWAPSPSAVQPQEEATGNILPARMVGMTTPRVAYYVYEQPPSGMETQLTMTPVAGTNYTDSRMTWGANRCYAVRAVEIVDALSVQSDEGPASCARLVDTFPPKPPTGLNAVAGPGEINLIWDPNAEADLDGYIVLRGMAPSGMLTKITPTPIHETSFRDAVMPGIRYIYAVEAVDKAGNPSQMSARIEDQAR